MKQQLHKGKLNVHAILEEALGKEVADKAMRALWEAVPEMRDKTRCVNCDASMLEYVHTFSWHHAMLLIVMANAVRDRRAEGMDFTTANRVHVPSLATSHSIKCATTQARFLGLVAKAKTSNGTQEAGTWLITARGWAALRGEEVPVAVSSFRNEILDRQDGMTTIATALSHHRHGEDADERDVAYHDGYRKEDWYEIGSAQPSRLFV